MIVGPLSSRLARRALRLATLAFIAALQVVPGTLVAQAKTSTPNARVTRPVDPAALAVAQQLLKLTNASATIIQGFEMGMNAQREAAGDQVPPAFFDSLMSRARASTDSLTAQLAHVYVESFSAAELRELVAFYESSVGKRLIEEQPVIFQRSAEIGQRWGMELGMKVAQEFIAAGKIKPPE